MKSKPVKKLTLNKETVRRLNDVELSVVVGGRAAGNTTALCDTYKIRRVSAAYCDAPPLGHIRP